MIHPENISWNNHITIRWNKPSRKLVLSCAHCDTLKVDTRAMLGHLLDEHEELFGPVWE